MCPAAQVAEIFRPEPLTTSCSWIVLAPQPTCWQILHKKKLLSTTVPPSMHQKLVAWVPLTRYSSFGFVTVGTSNKKHTINIFSNQFVSNTNTGTSILVTRDNTVHSLHNTPIQCCRSGPILRRIRIRPLHSAFSYLKSEDLTLSVPEL